jgi:hypothetical protein
MGRSGGNWDFHLESMVWRSFGDRWENFMNRGRGNSVVGLGGGVACLHPRELVDFDSVFFLSWLYHLFMKCLVFFCK